MPPRERVETFPLFVTVTVTTDDDDEGMVGKVTVVFPLLPVVMVLPLVLPVSMMGSVTSLLRLGLPPWVLPLPLGAILVRRGRGLLLEYLGNLR